ARQHRRGAARLPGRGAGPHDPGAGADGVPAPAPGDLQAAAAGRDRRRDPDQPVRQDPAQGAAGMIGFALSEEQVAVRDAARRFAAEVIRPVAARHDESGEFPTAAVEQALELGLLYGNVPEELGGPGLGLLEECIVAEEIAWGCAGFFAAWAASSPAMSAVLSHGAPRQKERYVRGALADRKLCAFALSEPDAGSDAGGIRTRARRQGDHYVLDGAKQWTTNAGHADFIVVFAATDPSKRHAGLSAFIVDRDSPGLRLGPREDMAGMRCADTRSLTLDACVVPADNLLGREGDGFR